MNGCRLEGGLPRRAGGDDLWREGAAKREDANSDVSLGKGFDVDLGVLPALEQLPPPPLPFRGAEEAREERRGCRLGERGQLAAQPASSTAASQSTASSVPSGTVTAALEEFAALPQQAQQLLELAMFIKFAQHRPKVGLPDLQAAAAALTGGTAIEALWRDSAPGESRLVAIKKKFDALSKTWRDGVNQVVQLATNREIPVLSVESLSPLSLLPIEPRIETLTVARVMCRGSCTLPPEVSAPWQWAEWWGPILAEGKLIGRDFSKGLHKVSAASGKSALNLRSLIGGHRPTSLRAVGLLLDALTSIDLRDNMLTADELAWLAGPLAMATSLSKLVLAGNPLDAATMVELFSGVTAGVNGGANGDADGHSSALAEIDISRTMLGGDTEEGIAQVGKLANCILLGGKLRGLLASHTSMSDGAGAVFIEELGNPSPPLEEGVGLMLTTLDLSRNGLGSLFADALPCALERLPKLATCSLAYNNLGSTAGASIVTTLLSHPSLRSVDLSGTNLTDSSPSFKDAPGSQGRSWSPKAISALAACISSTAVTELMIHANELCGLWRERVGGEPAMRGTYTSVAVEMMIKAINACETSVSLKKNMIKYMDNNFVRPSDDERLVAALQASSQKPPPVKEKEKEVQKVAAAVEESAAARRNSVLPERRKSIVAESPQEQRRRSSTVTPSVVEAVAAAVAAKEASGTASGKTDQPTGGSATDDVQDAPAATDANSNAEQDAPPKAPDAGMGATPRSRDKPGAPAVLGAGGKAKGKSGKSGKAGGKGEGKGEGKELPTVPETEEEKKKGSSNYGGYGQTKKVKKKVEKVVVEEKISPFAMSPLMVSLAPLVVRKGPANHSPLQGTKILPGSLVRVGGQESISHKEKLMTKPSIEVRMHIELDGDQEPLGWVTGVTKDEMETLKLAARGFPLMKAVKTLPLRDSNEPDAKKSGEIHKDTNVRIMETIVTEDGHEKVCGRPPQLTTLLLHHSAALMMLRWTTAHRGALASPPPCCRRS